MQEILKKLIPMILAPKEPWHDPELSHKDLMMELLLEEYLKRKLHQSPLQKADNPIKEMQQRKFIEDSVQDRLSQENSAKPYTPPKRTAAISPSYKILTNMESNAKTAKNAHVGGYVSAILHLAPSSLAGVGNVCMAASDGCKDACLNTAGRGGMFTEDAPINTIQKARIQKTKRLVQDPHGFFTDLLNDIHKTVSAADQAGAIPVVRLNGTSDLAWEKMQLPHLGGKNIFEAFPNVQFYDYTKRPDRVMKNNHPNYHLTFSRSESNEHMVKKVLSHGHNAAVVFGGKELPKEWHGFPVISGDEHDLRFLDEKGGKVVGLKAKGEGKSDKSGFVVWDHSGNIKNEAPKERVRNKTQEVASQAHTVELKKSDSPRVKGIDPLSAKGDKQLFHDMTPTLNYKDMSSIKPTASKNVINYKDLSSPKSEPVWKTKLKKDDDITKDQEALSSTGPDHRLCDMVKMFIMAYKKQTEPKAKKTVVKD